MASTYSNLKIQLMGTGENSGTWGTITNTNLGTAIEEAICESADVAFSQDSVVLSLSDSNASQTARHLRLNLTGTGSAGITLTVPDIEKNYIINNGLATDVDVKNSSGGNVTVQAGKSTLVYSTGSGVVDVIDSLTSLVVEGALAAGSGSVGGTFTITGSFSAASALNVGGNASVGGTLGVTGDTDVANLSASGTFDVGGNASVGGTLAVTGTVSSTALISDVDGDLREVPRSGAVKTDDYTFDYSDTGNHIVVASSGVSLTIPSSTFEEGSIISVISTGGSTATVSSNITSFASGDASATATYTLEANGVSTLIFLSAGYVSLTGSIS